MKQIAPDVGALVNFGLDSWGKEPGKYRVDGWMCEAEPPVKTGGMFKDVIEEILYKSCRPADETGKKRMRWCLREEATHLSLSGIAGAIAPIGEVMVTGHVSESWDKETVDEHRDLAIRLGQARELLF